MTGSLELSLAGAQLVDGPAGPIDLLLDLPQQPPRGMAIVCHPHPKMGGSAMHKVPHFLARALAQDGWLVLRPNFRGVGRSGGSHDEGSGETEDMLALRRLLVAARPELQLALVGFSFGAFVQARAARALADAGTPAWRVCVAGMPFGELENGRRYDTPQAPLADALVVHGEADERVPLAAVMDWARPALQPVVVVPGADHFFSGKLHVLRMLVLAHLKG